jgi:hypothetical protein
VWLAGALYYSLADVAIVQQELPAWPARCPSPGRLARPIRTLLEARCEAPSGEVSAMVWPWTPDVARLTLARYRL